MHSCVHDCVPRFTHAGLARIQVITHVPHVCTRIRACTHTPAHMHVFPHVPPHTCTLAHIHIHAPASTCVCLCACVYVHIACMHARIATSRITHLRRPRYTHVRCTLVHMYTYTHARTHTPTCPLHRMPALACMPVRDGGSK